MRCRIAIKLNQSEFQSSCLFPPPAEAFPLPLPFPLSFPLPLPLRFPFSFPLVLSCAFSTGGGGDRAGARSSSLSCIPHGAYSSVECLVQRSGSGGVKNWVAKSLGKSNAEFGVLGLGLLFRLGILGLGLLFRLGIWCSGLQVWGLGLGEQAPDEADVLLSLTAGCAPLTARHMI